MIRFSKSIVLSIFMVISLSGYAQLEKIQQFFWQSYNNDSLEISLKFPSEYSTSVLDMGDYSYVEIVCELEDQQSFIALIKIFDDTLSKGQDERNIDFLNEIENGFGTSNSEKIEVRQHNLQGREAEYNLQAQNTVIIRAFSRRNISIALFYVKPVSYNSKKDFGKKFFYSLRI